jgi:hypothetical protein
VRDKPNDVEVDGDRSKDIMEDEEMVIVDFGKKNLDCE